MKNIVERPTGTAAAIRAGTVARGGETAEISRKFQRWVGIMACKWPGWACMLAPYTTIIYIHLLEVLTAPGAVSDMCRSVPRALRRHRKVSEAFQWRV